MFIAVLQDPSFVPVLSQMNPIYNIILCVF